MSYQSIQILLEDVNFIEFDHQGNQQKLGDINSEIAIYKNTATAATKNTDIDTVKDIINKETNIWLAFCKFRLIISPIIDSNSSFHTLNFQNLIFKHTINYSGTSFTKVISKKTPHHIVQKIAVRQLAQLLIKNYIATGDHIDTNKINDLKINQSTFPYLLEPIGYPICFTHSKDYVACAIQRSGSVGIDMEINKVSMLVCQRYFADDEIRWLKQIQLKQENSEIAAKLLWMLKEAEFKRMNIDDHSFINFLKTSFLNTAKNLYEGFSNQNIESQTHHVTNHLKDINKPIFKYLNHQFYSGDNKSIKLYLYLPYQNIIVTSKI